MNDVVIIFPLKFRIFFPYSLEVCCGHVARSIFIGIKTMSCQEFALSNHQNVDSLSRWSQLIENLNGELFAQISLGLYLPSVLTAVFVSGFHLQEWKHIYLSFSLI